MGGVCCACTQEQKYRFKNFVVHVYPDKKASGPDADALDKLEGYCKSNPERIPRVCRKVNKLLIGHVRKGRDDRVMVSLMMLQALIDGAARAEGFVPHCIEICAMLLHSGERRYRIGAADLLAVLCRALTRTGEEPSCRLLADSKARLLPPLLHMCVDGAKEKRADRAYTQTRYSAIVALGHMCACLGSRLSGNVGALVAPLVQNLLGALQERAQTPLAEGEDPVTEREGLAEPPRNGALPEQHSAAVTQYVRASAFAVGAVSGCVTTATVEAFLSSLAALLDRGDGWRTPKAPALVYSSVVSAMQRRPQELGFTVYQFLCRAGQDNSDGATRRGIMRALTASLGTLSMTGGRPRVLLDYIVSVMRLPLHRLRADASEAELETAATVQADVLELLEALLQCTYRSRNFPQLQVIVTSVVGLLGGAGGAAGEGPSPSFVLRTVAVAAPYVRTVPLADRASLGVAAALRPFLFDDAQPAYRIMAARALAGLLAGTPAPGESAAAAPRDEAEGRAALVTDDHDACVAQEWTQEMVLRETQLSPLLLLECANVLAALAAGLGVRGQPFVLALLWQLQNKCANEAAAAAVGADVVSSTTPTSPLSRAWLHAILAVLDAVGRAHRLPKLSAYAADLLQRRQAAGELAQCFKPSLADAGGASAAAAGCGLSVDDARTAPMQPLSTQTSLPPVARLAAFGYVANIIADAEREDVARAYGAPSRHDALPAIERACFAPGSTAAALMVPAPAGPPAGRGPADADGADPLSFFVDPALEEAAAALSITVTSARAQQESRNQGIRYSAGATTNARRIAELLAHYGVDASTPPLLSPPPAGEVLPPLAAVAPSQETATALALGSATAPADMFAYARRQHALAAQKPALAPSWVSLLPAAATLELVY